MSIPVLEKCLEILSSFPISTIDITGGSPEMNPHLEWFIGDAARLNRRLIVRSNLTLLLEEPYRHFMDVFAQNKVEIVTSLPDYLETKSDRQRGMGVFGKVIEALRELNLRGYGMKGSGFLLISSTILLAPIFRAHRRRWNTSTTSVFLLSREFISINFSASQIFLSAAILIISSNPEILKIIYPRFVIHSILPQSKI